MSPSTGWIEGFIPTEGNEQCECPISIKLEGLWIAKSKISIPPRFELDENNTL